jgi:small subunit ribosomal protein S9
LADEFFMGTGRRKESIARVRIYAGAGEMTVNGKPLDTYFPNRRHRIDVFAPLVALDLKGSYDVVAKLEGGGISGQAGAMRLGIARALLVSDESLRADLKKGGFPQQRAQGIRPQGRAQEAAVLQALDQGAAVLSALKQVTASARQPISLAFRAVLSSFTRRRTIETGVVYFYS